MVRMTIRVIKIPMIDPFIERILILPMIRSVCSIAQLTGRRQEKESGYCNLRFINLAACSKSKYSAVSGIPWFVSATIILCPSFSAH